MTKAPRIERTHLRLLGLAALIMLATPHLPGAVGATEDLVSGAIDGKFTYEASNQGDGHRLVFVEYEQSTAGAVEAAADAMNARSAVLAETQGKFTGEIVFTRPLSFEEYTAFVEETGAFPGQTLIRAVDTQERLRVTIGAPPAPDGLDMSATNPERLPIDASEIEDMVDPHIDIRGVITARDVQFDAETYRRVAADDRVYAVSTLTDAIVNDLREAFPDVDIDKVVVAPSGLYWHMEDVGIAPLEQGID